MNIKEKLEQNILVVTLGASVAVGGTVFGVTQYFNTQRSDRLEDAHSTDLSTLQSTHAREIATIKSRLASIERGMPDQKYYDIRNLVHTSSGNTEAFADAHYFTDDGFYALRESDYWGYEKTTESKLAGLIVGEELPGAFAALTDIAPIHLWKSTNEFEIELDGDTMKLFPHIVVQRLSYETIPKLLNAGAAFGAWLEDDEDFDFDEEDLAETEDAEEFVNTLSSIMHEDMTGVFFQFLGFAKLQMVLLDPENVRYRLAKVQKVGNVLYSHSVTEFRGDGGDSKAPRVVYYREEMILVSTPNALYVIKLSVPSLDPLPRGESFTQVNGWLSNMRVFLTKPGAQLQE